MRTLAENLIYCYIINSMTAIDWAPIYNKYRGKWVALDKDEKTVLASGKTPKEAFNKASKEDPSRPILAKLPSSLASYVGTGHEIRV